MERLQPVRLEAVSHPHPLYSAHRDPDGTAVPVRALARRLREGLCQHLSYRPGRMGRCAGRAILVAQQALDARPLVAPLPAPYGRALTPARRATSWTLRRSVENRIVRARWICLGGRDRSPAITPSLAMLAASG